MNQPHPIPQHGQIRHALESSSEVSNRLALDALNLISEHVLAGRKGMAMQIIDRLKDAHWRANDIELADCIRNQPSR